MDKLENVNVELAETRKVCIDIFNNKMGEALAKVHIPSRENNGFGEMLPYIILNNPAYPSRKRDCFYMVIVS